MVACAAGGRAAPGDQPERRARWRAVPPSLEQSYRRRTIAAGTDHLLVQRVVRAPTHCQFWGETRDRAFDDLVAWIERGVKPEGEDVLASDLSRIGMKWTHTFHPEDPLAPQR